MKDRFTIRALIIIASFLITGAAIAQVMQIPGRLDAKLSGFCETVQQPRTNYASTGDIRVKRGGQVTVTGVRQTIFVEEGGVADVRGTASLVYVAKGGTVNVSGERHIVYSERGGNVFSVGRVTMNVVDGLDLHLHQNGHSCQ
jgi:phage tail tape-measure protein